jgi:hypothetical protein
MSVPELKAAGVKSLFTALQQVAAPGAFEPWVHTLPTTTAELVLHPRYAQEWVLLEHVHPAYVLAHADLFGGDIDKMFEVGRVQLRNDLLGIYRVFLRVASPAFVAERAAAIYGVYFRDCGALSVVDRGEQFVDVKLEQRPFPSEAFFHGLRGSIHGALELTGVSGLRVEIVGAPADDTRLYRATWR